MRDTTKLVTLKVEELGTVKAIYNDTTCDIKIGNHVNVCTNEQRLDGVIMNIKDIDTEQNNYPVIEAEDLGYIGERHDYWLELHLEDEQEYEDMEISTIYVIEPNGQTHKCVWLEDKAVNIGDVVSVYVATSTYAHGVVYNKYDTYMSKIDAGDYSQAYYPISDINEVAAITNEGKTEIEVVCVRAYIPAYKREKVCIYSVEKPTLKECDKVVINTNHEEVIGIVLETWTETIKKDDLDKCWLAKEYVEGYKLWNPYEDEEIPFQVW